MKKTLIFILGFILIGTAAYSQTKVDSLHTAITAQPINREIGIYDFHYKKVRSDSTSITKVRNLKVHPGALESLKLFGKVIDDAKLINYQCDTVYIFSTFYVPNLSYDNTIKTSKGVFKVNSDMNEKYIIRTIEDYYKKTSKYLTGPQFWESKRLIYKTIFDWDIEKLIKIIKSSGRTVNNNSATAVRIIIKDYNVLEIDVINFDDAGGWALNKDDLKYL